MAELIFPPSQEAEFQKPVAYEVGPNTLPYKTENGLTYFYDANKDSWVLKVTDAVTTDLLELELANKLSVFGGSIIGDDGSLTFTQTPYSKTPDRIVLETKGNLIFNSDQKNIVFNNLSMSPTRVYGFANNGLINPKNDLDEFKYVEFATRGLITYQNIHFAQTAQTSTLLSHSLSPTEYETVTLLDLNSEGDYRGRNVIKLPSENALMILSDAISVVTIETSNRGRVKVKPIANNEKTLVVTQTQNVGENPVDGVDVFRVDTDSHRIYCSMDYNEGLKNAPEGSVVEGSNSVWDFSEENLVATVGFVKEGFFKPGMNVFASSEDEAEVGGLWTDGFNYYVKVEDTTIEVD